MTVLRHTYNLALHFDVGCVPVGSSLVEEGPVVARAATVTSQRDTDGAHFATHPHFIPNDI
jgi:hypothetical protein